MKRLVFDRPSGYSNLAVGRAGTPSAGRIYLLFEGGAAQQAADGTVYFVWDFMRSSDQEILLTTFREEDVLAGSDRASARVKANRRLVSKGGVQ